MTDEVKVEAPVVDYGNEFVPEDAPKIEVELSPEDLKAIGRGPKEEKPVEEAKTPEGKAEGEKAAETTEEAPRDSKGKFIPKARFDELNTKAKAKVAALEAKLQAMTDRLAPLDGVAPDIKALEASLDTKEDEYGKFLADGELDKAKAVLKDINKLNRQLGAIEAGALASTHAKETSHVDALGQLVELYKENYPQFDDANKEMYDQDMVNFVADLQGRFEISGMSPAEALRTAVELSVARFKLDAAEPEPEIEAKPDVKGERKAASVAKAIKASNGQPPKLDKAGIDSDKMGISKIDISALSYEEFSRLPESTLKRLRGDLI